MSIDGNIVNVVARQLWNLPTETTTQGLHCTPFSLPSNGVIQLGDSAAITLTTDVIFQPECTGGPTDEIFPVSYLKEPFYSSTIPTVYVIAATTVIAWVLVVMLTITPRTNFFGVPTTAGTFINAHGIIGGANGGGTGLTGSGSRPWLQKAAALAVAISLTIATADTLEVAEEQYRNGYQDASGLRREVLGSLEIRIMRVISDIFLWLAQVQTLVRLFPRHKEKVLIKWIGFVLIVLDSIFSCLNSFLINSPNHGRKFVDAIPALSYLFELALGLLYAAWVMYYALTKRRYAFYNPKMRSIALIALLSIVAVLTPVVFFVTDVVNQDVAGWGDYFRWVGAAAASVVVWEWVERIEALERDDKKDGILGREIFDGDEMLDVVPGEGYGHSRNLGRNFRRHNGDDPESGGAGGRADHGLGGMANRLRSRQVEAQLHFPLGRAHSGSEAFSSNEHAGSGNSRVVTFSPPPVENDPRDTRIRGAPTPPPPIISPISRADTTSAASTVYVVRNPMADVPQPIRRRRPTNRGEGRQGGQQRGDNRSKSVDEKDWVDVDDETPDNRHGHTSRWRSVANPFKRKRTSPPQEIQRAQAAAPTSRRSPASWDVRGRLGDLTAGTSQRLRERAGTRNQERHRPVTVVPAQPRGSGRTWSPNERVITTSTPRPQFRVGSATARATLPTASGSGAVPLVQAQKQKVTATDVQSTAQQEIVSRGFSDVAVSSPLTWSVPPRADDISPPAGRTGARRVVIPAPRRTPSHQNTPSPALTGASSGLGTSAL